MEIKLIPISGCDTCKQVLIFLDRNDSGEDFVRLLAWHRLENEDISFLQSGEMDVFNSHDDRLMMERYIADFSEASANDFANSFEY